MNTPTVDPAVLGWNNLRGPLLAAACCAALLAAQPAGAGPAPATDPKAGPDAKAVEAPKTEEAPVYSNWIEGGIGTLSLQGNRGAFGHRHGQSEGVFGGIDDLHVQKELGKDGLLTFDGRAILDNNDYNLRFRISKNDLGYLEVGYKSFRTWYTGTGGYYPVDQAENFSDMFGDELALDRSELWVEMGLRIPKWPELTLRYSYETREGEKDSTSWGPTQRTGSGVTRLIVPALRRIDEVRQVFSADLAKTFGNTDFKLGGRYESTENRNKLYENRYPGQPASPASTSPIRITQHDDQDSDLFSGYGSTVTRINDRFWLSLAYSCTSMDTDVGGSRIYGGKFEDKFNPFGASPQGNGFVHLHGGGSVAQQVGNLNLMIMPTPNLTIIPEVKIEDFQAENDVHYIRTKVRPQPLDPKVHLWSSDDMVTLAGALDIRYTGIPNVVLYARGEWEQNKGNRQDGSNEAYNNAGIPLNLDVDRTILRRKYTVGFNAYPLSRLSLGAQYYHRTSTFDNDFEEDDPTSVDNQRMMNLNFYTDDVNVRVTWRPLPTLTLVTRWDWQHSKSDSRWQAPDTEAGYGHHLFDYGVASDSYNHVYSESITWNPLARWYIQASASYVINKIHTPATDNVVPDFIQDSRNDYCVVGVSTGVALDDRTEIRSDYTYYRADNYDRFSTDGMPYGATGEEHTASFTVTRQLRSGVKVFMRYGYYNSSDATSGSYNDYEGHLLYAGTRVSF